MSTLRIATLNIWNKSGPWQERLGAIRTELARLEPDVIGLQEVLRFAPGGGGLDAFQPTATTCQATEIAEGLGYAVAYAAATDYANGLLFGNALLSRHPILEQRRSALPGTESGESRSLLETLLDTPYGTLPAFVTHLNWKLHHGCYRLRQVKFIVERVFLVAPVAGPHLPPVLMGDFNADPDSDEIRYLRGLKVEDDTSVFLADAWVYGGDGSPGMTFDRRNPYAAVAHEPPRRIDYIFSRGPDALLRGEPVRTALAFDSPRSSADGSVWPSDHFGVVSDIFYAPRSP